MKRVVMSCNRPCFLSAERVAKINVSQVTVSATPTANRAVTGTPERVCATDNVMTPMIVPGLAANRIRGPSEVLALSVWVLVVGIAYASRAFALFYMLQCLVAFFVALQLKDLSHRLPRLIKFAFLAVICLLVFVLGIPSG